VLPPAVSRLAPRGTDRPLRADACVTAEILRIYDPAY
jgi:hypothetical protein